MPVANWIVCIPKRKYLALGCHGGVINHLHIAYAPKNRFLSWAVRWRFRVPFQRLGLCTGCRCNLHLEQAKNSVRHTSVRSLSVACIPREFPNASAMLSKFCAFCRGDLSLPTELPIHIREHTSRWEPSGHFWVSSYSGNIRIPVTW